MTCNKMNFVLNKKPLQVGFKNVFKIPYILNKKLIVIYVSHKKIMKKIGDELQSYFLLVNIRMKVVYRMS